MQYCQGYVQRPGQVPYTASVRRMRLFLTCHAPCAPVQALALQDVMGLLEGEVHCSVVSEASALRITAAGAAADAAESGAAPSAAASGAAASAKSGASAPSRQPRRFRVCDGQRQNNRALQPREWLTVLPCGIEFQNSQGRRLSSCCIKGALHGLV